MGTYRFRSLRDVTVQVDGQNVRLRPNEPYTTDDACKMAMLVMGWQQKMKAAGEDPSFTEEQEGLFNDTLKTCLNTMFPDLTNVLSPDTPAPNDNAGLGAGDRSPGTIGDTPSTMNAPQPNPNGEIEGSRTGNNQAGLPPGAQHHDRDNPRSLDDIANDALALGAGPAQAEQASENARRNVAADGQRHHDFSDSRREAPAESSDPVAIPSGEFTITTVDVELASIGFPLRLERIYRSGRVYFGPWGFQWDHNYNVSMRPLRDGNVAIWTGRLSEDLYERQADGTFEPPPGIFRKLVQDIAGPAPAERWTLSESAGRSFVFERPAGWPHGDRLPLVAIRDRNGNQHDLVYDAEGRLVRVEDEAGRFLQLAYGTCGLLELITDHTGRRWTYYHDDGIEHLVLVKSPATAEFPDGRTQRYEYDRFNAHPILQHTMIACIDGDGRITVENTYGQDPATDDFGRVVAQEFDGAVSRFSAERLQFVPSIPEAINVPALRVTVLDPGFVFIYTFNYRGDLLDRRYRLVVDGSWRLVADTYQYDAWGNVVLQYDSDGRGMAFEYDTANADPRARGNLLLAKMLASPLKPGPPIEVYRATYEPRLFQLQSFRDALGGITKFIYDYDIGPGGVGDLVELRRTPYTLPDGSPVTPIERFRHNARGQLIEHDQNGELHSFAYAAAGVQAGFCTETRHVRAGVSVVETYTRDDVGNIVTKTSGTGQVTTYEVDAFNLVRSVTRADGAVWQFGYDGVGRVAWRLEPRGEYDDPVLAGAPIRHEYSYTSSGFLARERFAANTIAPREFVYDRTAEGRCTQERDPIGRVIVRLLDERGLVLREDTSEANGSLLQRRLFRYGRTGELQVVRVEGGPEVRLDYDGYGRLREVVDPDGSAYRFERNAAGLVTRLTVHGRTGGAGAPVALLAEQALGYNEAGALRRRRDSVFDHIGGGADVYETQFWVDPAGRLLRERATSGLVNDFAYGPLGLLLSRTDSLGGGDEYAYDASGRPIKHTITETASDGVPASFNFLIHYDAAGRVAQEDGPQGESVSYVYDERDAMVAATNPLGSLLTHTFNAFGEPVSQRVGPSEVRWERDVIGRAIRFIDPASAVTSFTYDALSRLLEVRRGDGASQRFAYRADGALQGFQDYDGTDIRYELTPAGLPARIASTPAVGVAATPDLRLEYDGLRRIARAEYAGAEITRAYDSVGRMRRETAGTPLSVAYGSAGTKWRLEYPDGRVDARDHDAAGRLVAATQVSAGTLATGIAPGTTVMQAAWDGIARPAAVDLLGVLRHNWGYDGGGRLAALASSDGVTELFSQKLYRDRLGLAHVLDSVGDTATRLATRTDALQRLTEVRFDFSAGVLPADPAAAAQPALDAAIAAALSAPAARTSGFSWTAADTPQRREERDGTGNLLSATDYTTNALEQVSSVAAMPIAYDARGDIVSIAGRTFRYDAFRRLVAVEEAGTSLLLLGYDALGRLSWVDEPGADRTFRYLGDELVEVASGGAVIEQRVPGLRLDQPVAVQFASGTYFPLYDATGSIVALTDAAGSVVERYRYDVFGTPEIRSADGATVLPESLVGFRPHYHGRPWFPNAAVYDFRSRTYVPMLMGFLQPDPIAFSASWSHYGFARYNPYCFTDPNGTWVHLLVGAVIGGAIGGIGMALSGGDVWDVLVGVGAGAIGGALTAAGSPVAGAAIAGGIIGAWSGGRIGHQVGGTRGAVIGAVGGGVAGAALGAVTGAVGSRVGNAVGTRIYGSVFNAAVARGLSATTASTTARGASMVAGGYAGGATAGVLGNTAATVGVDVATGQPITASQLGTAVRDGLTRDGALGAMGASAERYALVARIPGMTGNRWGTLPGRANLGLEGEILVGRAIGVEPSRGADRLVVNGRTRLPDFPLNQTVGADASGNPVQNIPEVKNKAQLSTSGRRSDVAQIRDFAAAAAAGGGDVIVYHRPGMDTSPLAGIQNLVTLPIPQQPFVVPQPFGLAQRRPGDGSK